MRISDVVLTTISFFALPSIGRKPRNRAVKYEPVSQSGSISTSEAFTRFIDAFNMTTRHMNDRNIVVSSSVHDDGTCAVYVSDIDETADGYTMCGPDKGYAIVTVFLKNSPDDPSGQRIEFDVLRESTGIRSLDQTSISTLISELKVCIHAYYREARMRQMAIS